MRTMLRQSLLLKLNTIELLRARMVVLVEIPLSA
jgi:hypothetical protein